MVSLDSSICPKCASDRAATRWCPGTADSARQPGCNEAGEHMHRRCARCGFCWLEDPLDVVDGTAETGR